MALVNTDNEITPAFTQALLGAQRALSILSKGPENARSDRVRLADAVANLNAYLAELER